MRKKEDDATPPAQHRPARARNCPSHNAFPYDPTISLPALSFPAMDSGVWDPSAQDITRTTTATTAVSDELVDVPTLQHFSWPHDGITENYFSDMLGSTGLDRRS